MDVGTDMIERISATEVLADCRRKLGMRNAQAVALDDATLAGLGRRSAGIHCPCSQATLRASLLECTRGLPAPYDSLPEAVDETIESLIVGGDLLELNDVATEDSDARQTWVFAAPPGFVVRPSGSVFLFGVVPDQDSFLPSTFSGRILHRGATRLLEPRPGENLPDELSELGLQELSDGAWLRSPRPEDPASLITRHEQILARQTPVTDVPDLQILDSARPVTYYRGRWVKPTNQDGMFVARRPQEFGAPIWCPGRLAQRRSGPAPRLTTQADALARLRRRVAPSNGHRSLQWRASVLQASSGQRRRSLRLLFPAAAVVAAPLLDPRQARAPRQVPALIHASGERSRHRRGVSAREVMVVARAQSRLEKQPHADHSTVD